MAMPGGGRGREECCMVKFGKRLCELSPISRWNPGRNSLTIQLQLGIPRPGWSPKLGKFGGLGWRGKEVTHTSPSVMQISVWPVIRSQPRGGVCSHDERSLRRPAGQPTRPRVVVSSLPLVSFNFSFERKNFDFSRIMIKISKTARRQP